MKNKQQAMPTPAEPEAAKPKDRVPFFARKIDPQALRIVQGGGRLEEADQKLQ